MALDRRTLLLASLSALPLRLAHAWPKGTQHSALGGVAITVAPDALDEESATWNFTLIVHSEREAVMDDFLQTAALAGGGLRRRPVAWEGDPPGGRERWGTLAFAAIRPRPGVLQLEIMRPGEKGPRIFQWTFAAWEA